MSFEPDIVVEMRDYPELVMVVEAKLRDGEPPNFQEQLLRYLRGRGGDFALLVTPHTVTLYRDDLTRDGPDALQKTGPLPLGDLFGVLPPLTGRAAGIDFEDRVQTWIEQMALEQLDRSIPVETREVLRRRVLPYLGPVIVRAAGPRWLQSAELERD